MITGTKARQVALYVDPPTPHFLGDVYFKPSDPRFPNGDAVQLPWTYLHDYFEARGIPVHTPDLMPASSDGVQNIYVSFGLLDKYHRMAQRADTTVSAFFALECPIVDPLTYRQLNLAKGYFKRVFSWSDSPSLESFVGGPLACEHYYWPQAFNHVHDDLWRRSDRKFLTIITNPRLPAIFDRELYTERVRAIAYFAQFDEIDLYGPGWDKPPYQLGRTWLPYTVKRLQRAWQTCWERIHPDPAREAARRVWRGPAASKRETLSQYTFAICYENMILKGWITEKIFDCFYVGTIPIYWGEPNIEEIIPPDCYVDMRQFTSYDELRRYLKSLGPAQIQNYREASRAYLGSPQARPFSKEAFVDIFRRIIREDAGVEVEDPRSEGHHGD